MMPHLPGPPGTLFNNDQRTFVAWCLDWQEISGYAMWHNYYDGQVSEVYNDFRVLINPHIRFNGLIEAV